MHVKEIASSIGIAGYQVVEATAVSATQSDILHTQVALLEPTKPLCQCVESLPPNSLVMYHGRWVMASDWLRRTGTCPHHWKLSASA